MAIELDGGYHDHVQHEDLARQRELEALGWKVIRFANEDVIEEIEDVLRAICRQAEVEYSFARRKGAGNATLIGEVEQALPGPDSPTLPQAGG